MCVTEFSPIYWFHEDEVYLPIDPKILVENSELYLNGEKVEFNGSIDDLEFLDESGINHWLAIPNVNLGYPDSNKDETIKSPYGIGPKNVSNFIKNFYKKYEKNYGNIIYYRKGTITISNNDFDANVFSGKWSHLQTILPGEYKIIQYFPFYFFNDFTNLHVGDWDSTVEIIINVTKKKTWIRTSAHHYKKMRVRSLIVHFWFIINVTFKENLVLQLPARVFLYFTFVSFGRWAGVPYNIPSALISSSISGQ